MLLPGPNSPKSNALINREIEKKAASNKRIIPAKALGLFDTFIIQLSANDRGEFTTLFAISIF